MSGPGGFDIFSTPDGLGGFDDAGYALLLGGPGGASINLYRFALPDDLSGGISLSSLRSFGSADFGGLQGLAVIDSAALPPIPLPASLALSATAVAAMAALRLRRRGRTA